MSVSFSLLIRLHVVFIFEAEMSRNVLVERSLAIKTDGDYVFVDPTSLSAHSFDASDTGLSIIQEVLIKLDTSISIIMGSENNQVFFSGIIEKACTNPVKYKSELIDSYFHRAIASYQLGQFDLCIADVNVLLELQPNCAVAYVMLSKAFGAKKQIYQAYENVLQACILEQFEVDELNKMLQCLIKQISKRISPERRNQLFGE